MGVPGTLKAAVKTACRLSRKVEDPGGNAERGSALPREEREKVRYWGGGSL